MAISLAEAKKDFWKTINNSSVKVTSVGDQDWANGLVLDISACVGWIVCLRLVDLGGGAAGFAVEKTQGQASEAPSRYIGSQHSRRNGKRTVVSNHPQAPLIYVARQRIGTNPDVSMNNIRSEVFFSWIILPSAIWKWKTDNQLVNFVHYQLWLDQGGFTIKSTEHCNAKTFSFTSPVCCLLFPITPSWIQCLKLTLLNATHQHWDV